jgi:hypothetical protein
MREDPSGLADGLATGGKQFVMVNGFFLYKYAQYFYI